MKLKTKKGKEKRDKLLVGLILTPYYFSGIIMAIFESPFIWFSNNESFIKTFRKGRDETMLLFLRHDYGI